MQVLKLNEHGEQVWQYPATLLTQNAEFICVEAYFNRDDMDLGYTTFRRGDRFVEYFYSRRWYNIFVIYAKESDQLKGWYCNICRPASWENGEIRCEDLALDVWVDPQGSAQVLDRDEFEQLGISRDERKTALAALDDLLQRASSGQLPA